MHTHSVRTDGPPEQDDIGHDAPRRVIETWACTTYDMRLEDTGDGGAAIVQIVGGKPSTLGGITFDEPANLHTITWNDTGRMEFDQDRRDRWDDHFYDTMEKWVRRPSA